MAFIGYALAALIGLSLGVMGGGGSILTVPIFVYVLGFDPKIAIAMSLPVVGATSLIGAVSHWREGNVKLKTAAMFGLIAMAGAYAGARLSIFLSGSLQLIILAVVMLLAAVSMFRSARRDSRGALDSVGESRVGLGLLIPVALGVGLLTGLVGIGGGFLVVPALVLLARVPMKQAVGTSLLVIAMNSLSGSLGYLGQVTMPWGFMFAFTAIAAAGILAGTRIVRFVPQAALKRGFAVFLVLMGTFILYKNRQLISRTYMTTAADTQPPVRLPYGFSPLPGVLTAGQPSASQFTQLARSGIKTVIDLCSPDEPRGFDEPATVRAAGMTYRNIPVTPGTLGDREFDELRALLGDASARPVLVHCVSANRVGALLIPYLVLDGKRSFDDALEIAGEVGLRSGDLARAARTYVAAREGGRSTTL